VATQSKRLPVEVSIPFFSGFTLKGDLLYGATAGEETGDGGAEGCLERAGAITMMDRGYMADAAINLDGGATATITQVHLLWMRVVVPGRSAHSSTRGAMLQLEKHNDPTVGVSAIDKARLIMDALLELEREWSATKKFYLLPKGHYTIGPNVLRGGPDSIGTPYIIPNHCDIDYCVWALQTEPVEQAKTELLAAINDAAAKDWWLADHPPTVTWELWWPPFFTPADHMCCVEDLIALEHHTSFPTIAT
jgi:acetylornithine deacetylase